MLANRAGLPETAFNDALNAALSQNHLRARPMTPALVDQMNLEKSLAFYKDRFADASDFTFVFVGSFDLPTMKPLVERYLASLPALHRNETARDVGPHPPAGVVQNQVASGVEPRSEVSIVFSGTFPNDELHRVIMRVMAETLSGSLHRTLREDLGGTYSVSVEPRFTKRPTEEYRIGIDFGCDPARMESLVTTVFQVIEQFKAAGPSTGQVADAKSALARDLETNSRTNDYLLNRIVSKYANGEDVADVFTMPKFYDQLTPGALRDAARSYLNPSRYVKVTLVPERVARNTP
jgi:zinc protease